MNTPKVSVIMCAYNASATIAQAARSVLAQTCDDLELIICDDASTDGTGAALDAIVDPRLRRLRNEQNLGPGPSRDRAIDSAHGDWIAFIDADDAFHPERIALLLAAVEGMPATMVFDDIQECRDDRGELTPWTRIRGPGAFGSDTAPVTVPAEDWIQSPRLLIKPMIPLGLLRDAGLRHSRRRYAEDTEFFLAIVATGITIRYLPKPLYYYRNTPGSASSTASRHTDMLGVLREAKTWFARSPAILAALDWRIDHECRMQDYCDFMASTRALHIVQSLRLVYRHPQILLEFARRSLRELPYHIGRLAHSKRIMQ